MNTNIIIIIIITIGHQHHREMFHSELYFHLVVRRVSISHYPMPFFTVPPGLHKWVKNIPLFTLFSISLICILICSAADHNRIFFSCTFYLKTIFCCCFESIVYTTYCCLASFSVSLSISFFLFVNF